LFSGTASGEAPTVLAPVILTDGIDGASDTVRVLGSGNSNFSLPIALGSAHAGADTDFTIKAGNNIGNSQGDLMLAVFAPTNAPALCTLFTVNVNNMISPVPTLNGDNTPITGAVPAGTQLLESRSASAPDSAVVVGARLGHAADGTSTGRWNGDGATQLIPTTYTAENSYLVNLGTPATFISRSYTVSANSLRMKSFNASTGTVNEQDVYAGIVNLQAVYGKAKNNLLQQVDTWEVSDPAADPVLTDSGGKQWSGWARVMAVRIAVVARSQQFEKTEVTPVQPTWRPNGVDPVTLKVDANADWKHYRYKVYETVVPLRNMLWQS
jgi:type IV pilus assembly protein PilW